MTNQPSSVTELPILKLHPEAVLPTRAHAEDAGLDMYSLEDVHLEPQKGILVRTGIAMGLPIGYVGLVADRSSLGKKGMKITGGVIDAGYRGEIFISIWNLSSEFIFLKKGDKIAQMLILPIVTPAPLEVQGLDATSRGEKGFGSSGR